MKASALCLLVLIGSVVLVSGVSASIIEETGKYTVEPAGRLHLPTITPLVSSTITQGEIDVYYRTISSGTS